MSSLVKPLFFTILCSSVSFSHPAFSQDVDEKKNQEQLLSLDQRLGFFGSALTVEGSTTGSTINAKTSFDVPKGFLSSTKLTLSVDAPLDKEAKRTDYITNFDLNGEYSGSIALTHGFSSFKGVGVGNTASNTGRIIKKIRDRCLEIVKSEAGVQPALIDDAYLKKKCPDGEDSKYWARPENARYRQYGDAEKLNSSSSVISAFKKSSYNFVGLELKFGRDAQSFRSITDFTKTDRSRLTHGVSAYFGRIPEIGNRNVGNYFFGVNHEVKYKDADQRTLCRPATSTDPIECFTASYEPPEKKESTSVYGLTRVAHTFGSGDVSVPIALEVKVGYDLTDDEFGVEVPLFFMPDKDGNLVGGIRARFDEGNEDEFSLGFFVGQKFDLFGAG